MATTLKEKLEQLPHKRRAHINKRATELVASYMTQTSEHRLG